MSYRLINANDIAAIWPGVNDMPCIYADLPCGLDGGHYDMREPGELQRENAKLREELESVGTAAYLYGRSDLKTENDKLRELVQELYEDQCDECDRWKYRDRMQELGVEV